MTSIESRLITACAVVFLLCSGSNVQAQNINTDDVSRLQAAVEDADRAVRDVRDSQRAESLKRQIEDLREEVIYYKVGVRKGQAASRQEYSDMQRRIDDVRQEARRDTGTRSDSAGVFDGGRIDSRGGASTGLIPSGTELDVRLTRSLNSATAEVEDRVQATTIVDLREGDRVVVPAGSQLRGIVNTVAKATRVERKGSLTVSFDQITVNRRALPISASVTQALESEGIRGEAGKIGAGAGVGAIIGGIVGGLKGAVAGILIGGGGMVAATEGKDVDLPSGTILRIRLEEPLDVGARGGDR